MVVCKCCATLGGGGGGGENLATKANGIPLRLVEQQDSCRTFRGFVSAICTFLVFLSKLLHVGMLNAYWSTVRILRPCLWGPSAK